MHSNGAEGGGDTLHTISRGHVIVVDDDALVLNATASGLIAHDFTVGMFQSGSAFLDSFDVTAPACIILDIMMPEMDGYAVLCALSERRARQPIIMLTGQGAVRHAVEAMRLGAVDVFEKPCDFELMARTIDQHLAHWDHKSAARAEVDKALELISRLSVRENEVLNHLRTGKANKAIAFDLGLSTRTVEMHRGNLMQKLGARTLPDMLRIVERAEKA